MIFVQIPDDRLEEVRTWVNDIVNGLLEADKIYLTELMERIQSLYGPRETFIRLFEICNGNHLLMLHIVRRCPRGVIIDACTNDESLLDSYLDEYSDIQIKLKQN